MLRTQYTLLRNTDTMPTSGRKWAGRGRRIKRAHSKTARVLLDKGTKWSGKEWQEGKHSSTGTSGGFFERETLKPRPAGCPGTSCVPVPVWVGGWGWGERVCVCMHVCRHAGAGREWWRDSLLFQAEGAVYGKALRKKGPQPIWRPRKENIFVWSVLGKRMGLWEQRSFTGWV